MGLRTWLGLKRRPVVPARQSAFQQDRIDGLGDILRRAGGASVLDVGTNRGLVAYELAWHGASVVHGCDIYEPGLATAREIFATMPCESLFVFADLTRGPGALQKSFGHAYRDSYDIVLFMAVYQKFRDTMGPLERDRLLSHLAQRTGSFLLFRERLELYPEAARQFEREGLCLAQCSILGPFKQTAGSIWARPHAIELTNFRQRPEIRPLMQSLLEPGRRPSGMADHG